MSNFNEDRRQTCVDSKCEPYRDNWKGKKNIYNIKYKASLGWVVLSCSNYCNCSNC